MTNTVMDAKRNEFLFITEVMLKTTTPISANKVQTSLINYITLAQDMYIKQTLGRDLYALMRDEWIASTYNTSLLPDGTYVDPSSTPNANPPIVAGDTTNYLQLYNEILKPLIWYSYVLALPHIAIKVEETGVMLNSTDYSESSGMVGLNKLEREGKGAAQVYMEDLKHYIYTTFTCKEVSDAVDVGGASIGIFVPRRRHHKRRPF